MEADFDIAVVGSGFGGSLLAMVMRRVGRSVVLLERDRHPRFAIGESSTPLANLLLEELATRYELPQVAPLAKWGTWQKRHPEIACGLKRGFTFYHHRFGQAWVDEPNRHNELMVAASPHDAIADTHWYRPDFDHFLARQAEELGVALLQQVEVKGAKFSHDGIELSGQHEAKPFSLRARFMVDASGPHGFFHRALRLPDSPFVTIPPTQALFTHFRNVRRWSELHPLSEPPPYPVDNAAMHHVFDGGWVWVLRFNNGITSAGVACTDALAHELNLSEGDSAWARLLGRLPSVREQFKEATAVFRFVHVPRLAFRKSTAAGSCWALLPSSAGFVDPLLSTGFPLTLLGIQRLANLLEKEWDSPTLPAQLLDYSALTLSELDSTAELVGALYANMNDFASFTALTLLYFAAASFSETARRLNRAELAESFLLRCHPVFAPRMRECLMQALRPPTDRCAAALSRAVCQAIQPINLAALGDPARRNWYPVLASDLVAAADKLAAPRREVEALLAKCGFFQAHHVKSALK